MKLSNYASTYQSLTSDFDEEKQSRFKHDFENKDLKGEDDEQTKLETDLK